MCAKIAGHITEYTEYVLSIGAIFKFVSRKHSSEKLEREGEGLQISTQYLHIREFLINSTE